VDVFTVQEDGRVGDADPDVLDRAGELGRVVFTQDADFLAEGTRRQRAGIQFAGVIYAHQLRVSVAQCIDDLELVAGALDLAEFEGRVEYLPLR
jgi:predicted nuclease of predicted toxin-antitoxin system